MVGDGPAKRELEFKEDGQEYAQVRAGASTFQPWRSADLLQSHGSLPCSGL